MIRGTLIAAWLSLFILSGCELPYREAASEDLQSYSKILEKNHDEPVAGQTRFAFDDFSALNTENLQGNAVPWKLVGTSLYLLYSQKDKTLAASEATVLQLLKKFGFMTPDRIENWLGSQQPKFVHQPLGMVRGTIRVRAMNLKVQLSNLNCSACHSSPTYDASGTPTRNAWLGAPNTSLNLEGYYSALYQGMKLSLSKQADFFEALTKIYPNTTSAEIFTYSALLFPQLKKRMAELDQGAGRFVPFSLGGPSYVNGIGAFKRILGLVDEKHFHAEEASYASMPDLSDLAFRSSLTWDGIYGRPGMTRFEPIESRDATAESLQAYTGIVLSFPVQAMGLRFERMEQNMDKVSEVLRFVGEYRGQKFPGSIDSVRAGRGSAIFGQSCAGCHGTYTSTTGKWASGDVRLTSFPNKLVPQDKNGTDPARWNLDPDALKKCQETRFGKYVDLQVTGGYVAPKLTNLWMTAPYLHNGSVPTVWDLMHPESRPAKFYAGGHSLSFAKLGIDYPKNYQPWSEPVLYDTSLPGHSNAGHDWQFKKLTEDQKTDLIEFLKVL